VSAVHKSEDDTTNEADSRKALASFGERESAKSTCATSFRHCKAGASLGLGPIRAHCVGGTFRKCASGVVGGRAQPVNSGGTNTCPLRLQIATHKPPHLALPNGCRICCSHSNMNLISMICNNHLDSGVALYK
jgi:hypothetical protein